MRLSRRLFISSMRSDSSHWRILKMHPGKTNVGASCMIHLKCGLSAIPRKHPPLSTSQSAMEEQVETLRKSLDNLQNKLQVGLEIENHLKKNVRALEKQKILSEEKLRAQISAFRHYHSQHRLYITSLLDDGFSHIKSARNMVEEKLKGCSMSERDLNSSQVDDLKFNELEHQDVRINNDDGSDLIFKKNEPSLTTTVTIGNSDASKDLALALNEKVETLLLLSQQEERHLLERNVNAALQKKIEEFQRNLLQVTNEKVKALMEFAQLKRDHQSLQEYVSISS